MDRREFGKLCAFQAALIFLAGCGMGVAAYRCVAITDSQGADNLLCGPTCFQIAAQQYQNDGTDLAIYNKCQDAATFQTALTGTQYGGASAVANAATLTPAIWIVGLGNADWLFNVAGRKGSLATSDATALFTRIRSYGPTRIIFMNFQQIAPGTQTDYDAFMESCGAQADYVCTVPMYELRTAGLLMNDGPAFPTFGLPSIHPTTVAHRFIADMLLDTMGLIFGIGRQPFGPWDSAAQALAARTSTGTTLAAWTALTSNWNG